jgi:hypothetical protein
MKKTAWIWAFLVCFMSYQGFAEGKSPVTPRMISVLNRENYKAMKFYFSKPFDLIMVEQNDTKGYEVKDNKFVKTDPAEPKTIKFSDDSEGILNDIKEQGRVLIILFQEQGETYSFTFTRNAQEYVLSSVGIPSVKLRQTIPSEPIQLCAVVDDNSQKKETEVKVIFADFEYSDNKLSSDYNYISYQNTGNYNDNYAYNVSYNSHASPSRKIMGSGSISSARVIEYVKTKKNLTSRDIAIIEKYFEEARIEGVNVDIAIAQMLYWTNNLKNNQRVASNNYGGLSPLPQNNFYGSFTSMTIGVRAHIQHLKGYANVPLNRDRDRELVDPRYYLAVERGFTGITFDQVYRSWSANSRYGQEIDYILRNLSR